VNRVIPQVFRGNRGFGETFEAWAGLGAKGPASSRRGRREAPEISKAEARGMDDFIFPDPAATTLKYLVDNFCVEA
jgi:hypothetical protein